jgi:hypothetical protein
VPQRVSFRLLPLKDRIIFRGMGYTIQRKGCIIHGLKENMKNEKRGLPQVPIDRRNKKGV